jgi:hypothetical protein
VIQTAGAIAILWDKLSGSSVAILILVAALDKPLSSPGAEVACHLLSTDRQIEIVELFNVLPEWASGSTLGSGRAL